MLRELLVVVLLPILCLGLQGDLNEDGCVDFQDLSILADNWGKCDMSNYWLKNTFTTGHTVTFDTPSQFNVGTDDFSVSFVIKTGSIVPYSELYPLSLANLTNGDGFGCYISDSYTSNKIRISFLDNITESVSAVTNNGQYYICITVDRNDLMKLYIDGELVSSVNCSADAAEDVTFNTGEFCAISESSGAFELYIDQPFFIRGVVLNSDQAGVLYNSSVGGKLTEVDIEALSPVSAWYAELDEGTGNPTGRYYNGTTWVNSGATITGGDVAWVTGGTATGKLDFLYSFLLTNQIDLYKCYVNKTSGAIQYRFKSRGNFQLRDIKLLEPEILEDR